MSGEILFSNILAHRTILLACSAKKMDALADGISAMGGIPLRFPVIEVQDIQDKQPLDKALASLGEYAWVVFTSAYGVKFFVRRLEQLGIRQGAESMPKICAIGPATAREVREAGYDVELVPKMFVAEGVVEALRKYHGSLDLLARQRVLIPRAKEAREVLPEALTAAGICVDAVPCYQTICAEPSQEALIELRKKSPDMLLFTSSSAIRGFVEILGYEEGTRTLRGADVAVLGPITATAAESFGKIPNVLPAENTVASLLSAIADYYRSKEKKPFPSNEG